jgi:hypothetical protein
MARTMFLTNVVGKVLMWGVMWLGIYLAIRAFIDGEVVIGVVILLVVIPLALLAGRLIVGIATMLFLIPLSFIVRRRREFTEFTNFQLAVADSAGTDRLNLRQGRMLLRMFKELLRLHPVRPRGRAGSSSPVRAATRRRRSLAARIFGTFSASPVDYWNDENSGHHHDPVEASPTTHAALSRGLGRAQALEPEPACEREDDGDDDEGCACRERPWSPVTAVASPCRRSRVVRRW